MNAADAMAEVGRHLAWRIEGRGDRWVLELDDGIPFGPWLAMGEHADACPLWGPYFVPAYGIMAGTVQARGGHLRRGDGEPFVFASEVAARGALRDALVSLAAWVLAGRKQKGDEDERRK